MSRFPEQWLHLREPFDHAARSVELPGALLPALAATRPLKVVELGAGLGSGMRFLAPRLPGPQHWTLIDHDHDLLSAVGEPPAPDIIVETLVRDLEDLSTLDLPVDLVSTQALLDLVSQEWLEALCGWVVRRRVPLLAALTVDGRVRWLPEDPRDAAVQAAFRAHQHTDRGFGPSPGPEAATVLAGLLSRSGYEVSLARADWEVGPDSRRMLEEMVAGTAHAAAEAAEGITSSETVAAWRSARMAEVAAGTLSLQVGHLDLLALP